MALQVSNEHRDEQSLRMFTPLSISAIQYMLLMVVGHPSVGPDRPALIQQVQSVTSTKCTSSTAGILVDLVVGDGASKAEARSMRLSGIDLEIDGLANGACLIVFVDDGLINALELATYGENLPPDWSSRVRGIRMDKRL
jgi:hypothetical protein